MRLTIAFAALICVAAAGPVAALDDPDLIFYFPFEQLDGDTALDQSGKGYNGTINGDIGLVEEGKRGKAAEFQMGSAIAILRDLVESDSYVTSRHEIPLLLGKDGAGHPIISDLTLMPHLLIAGATGSGKSVCLNSTIITCLMTRSPEELKLILSISKGS